MIKRIAGFTASTLAATAVALGAATMPAQADTDTNSNQTAAIHKQERALKKQTSNESQATVSVPGGYEAATIDQKRHIRFWHTTQGSTKWHQVGHSRYPKKAPGDGPVNARVKGAHLTNMQHATFIVHGVFTGDATGNAVAFTTGNHGWGTIKAKSDGNLASSGGVVGSDMIGLEYDFAFVNGNLQTKGCPTDHPIAECGQYPVVKLWHWTGTDFAATDSGCGG